MNSGIMYNFLDPITRMISLDDIVHSLAKEQRFANQLDENWTVLHHVLLVVKIVKSKSKSNWYSQYQALHHDDFEAYGRDIPTPMKDLLPEYRRLERIGNSIISEKFSVNLLSLEPEVEFADNIAMKTEDLLFSKVPSEWNTLTIEEVKNSLGENILSFIELLQTRPTESLKEIYLGEHEFLNKRL